jgi:alkanesulfonate monooxygenase SsuD/methylene tetrahydromethanopterin reductase-like flavin-dependent oxidoreductase (luciferase family)
VKKGRISFGCYIYQDGLEYKDIQRTVLVCERLGFDSVWLKDNFIPWMPTYFSNEKEGQEIKKERKSASMLECWTTLSALATMTKEIRLGAILVNLYRNPVIVAKMFSTLDVISNGRTEMGLSAGWYERECQAYGISFPKGSVRIGMLEESIKIIRKMLCESSEGPCDPSFKGKYYVISKAVCNPRPIQRPCPPIWIGGGGKHTLKLAATYADGWNYGLCSYNEYLDKLMFLSECCRTIGRNYDKLIKGWQGMIIIGKDWNELRDKKREIAEKTKISNRRMSEFIIAGTADEIIKELGRYMDKGVNYFTVYFPDLPGLRSLQLFARYVIPHFRN